MTQSFDITFEGDGISEVIILGCSGEGFDIGSSEDWIVDDDTVNFWVIVGFVECGFDVYGVLKLS